MQFILKHGQPAVRIQTMLAFCRADCLERSLASSHRHRRELQRAIRHNLQAQLLNSFDAAKNRRKLQHGKSKQQEKLKSRAGQLEKYGHFLVANIRRLRRLERKQSLLSAFLIRRVEQYRLRRSSTKLSAGDRTTVLDPYTAELSEELFQSVYGSGKGRKQSQKEQQKTPKKVTKPEKVVTTPSPSKVKAKGVEGTTGRNRQASTTTFKPRKVPRKDEL